MKMRIAVAVGTASLLLVLAGCGGQTADSTGPVATSARARAAGESVATTTTTTTLSDASGTLIATVHGAAPGSAQPGEPPDMTVPATWYGYPSVLPVVAMAPGWFEVRLAQRPNGSTTWVPAADVTLSSTPYRLVLDLATEHLAVYDNGQEISDFPAGIGTPDDPTVTGSFFITMTAAAPDPGYGPFVLVTSAHSDTITDWEQSGDAIIAIHGPITQEDDTLIGTTGAAISHGCIRLHDSDLAQLATIPPGTSFDVVG